MAITLTANKFAPVEGKHGGTGAIKGKEHFVLPGTVDRPLDTPLEFPHTSFSINVMSFETTSKQAPNWFGVSFREDIESFNTVNIFCHPSPANAKMKDDEYHARAGNWPNLFRYAEILGRQMDYAHADQVVIVPFFNNAAYSGTGVFGPNWQEIVEQILVMAGKANNTRGGGKAKPSRIAPAGSEKDILHMPSHQRSWSAAPPTQRETASGLKHVVLSCFSHGRELMWTLRKNSPGIEDFLREVWDFDGVHGPPPLSSGKVRGILYNQSESKVRQPDVFQVPPKRWAKYHGDRQLNPQTAVNVHSNIPTMLAVHAAAISGVRT